MTRMIAVVACAAAAVLSLPAFAGEQADVLQPVYQFVNAMNRGDRASALAACADEMAIIDNVAPYTWRGKGACGQWADAQDADSTQKGVTDVIFRIGDPSHVMIDKDTAYAVLPASYTFREKGRPGGVQGTLTAVLRKGTTGWQMTAFAFAEQ